MLKLKNIFTHGMIMQQKTENFVCGKADPGKDVFVVFDRGGEIWFATSVKADDNGDWRVSVPARDGGLEAYSITAGCEGEKKIIITDVMFGEVFHISGQSNMELPMSRTRDPFRKDPEVREYPYIREYRVPIKCRFSKTEQSDDFPEGGEWKSAIGSNIANMSAAGYYFAEDIWKRKGVPVGLVNTSAGGAAVESFMPYDMIHGYKIHDEFLEEATKENYIEDTTARDLEAEKKWYEALGNEDFGLTPSDDMKTCIVPCQVNELPEFENGEFSGRIFFFKKFTINEHFPLNGAELILGTITDSDAAFINGVQVGETAYMYPPRYYKIPDGVLKRGENILAVRVEIKGGSGGFTKGRRLCVKSGVRTVNLGGEWQYAVAKKAENHTPAVFFQGLPLALHADMMYPAMQYKYRALLFYQGETNCGRAEHYRQMFGDFIEYYRKNCGYEIPVIYVQLCSHEGMNGYDESQSWAKLRQAQLECLEIPNTAMAVTVDVGEYNDLHPTRKRDIGKRLAYHAGGLLYGDETVFVKCLKAEAKESENGTDITLSLSDNAFLKNNRVGAFEVVFEDGIFRCEETAPQLCGKTLLLHCGHKGKPVSVRYAWRNAPYELDLYDIETKPVSPFEIKL